MRKEQILSNITVLELASVLAGPNVGAFFAEMGARVIKVENLKTGGDVTRKWKLPTEDKDADISGYFSCANWGKESISVNVKKPEGLKIVYDLVKHSDIVLLNYKPGDAEKLKLDYPQLRKLKPNIIYAHLTGYGLDMPWAGYDAIIQAETGFTYMNGEPDSKPTKMPVALMDILAAHHLKEAILMALLKREKTGEGSFVTSSLFEAGIASLANQATNWLVGDKIPRRMGSDHPNIVPYGTVFKTADDKEVVLAIGSDRQFQILTDILGKPELADDERFKSNFERVQNRGALKAILANLISKKDRETLLKELRRRKVPSGAVNTMKEVFSHPIGRKMTLKSTTGDGNPIKGHSTVAIHFRDNENPEKIVSPPPHYGEHTIEILRDLLNFEDKKIETLISEEVIYARKRD